jgi:hypothetical protein
MKQPNYRFYATLLDGYQNYLDSSQIYDKFWGFSENAARTAEEFEQEQFQSLINRINRVPLDSEPADRGTCFNEVIDCLILNKNSDKVGLLADRANNKIIARYNNREFVFQLESCINIAKKYSGAIPQVFTSGFLETRYGLVELYGYIDEIMPTSIIDIKVKGRYEAFSFKGNWQHKVYPYCLAENGVFLNDFYYDIYVMNKDNIITEQHKEYYSYTPQRDIPDLISHCEELIGFLERNKHLITDLKIFGS